jgi:endonuclease III
MPKSPPPLRHAVQTLKTLYGRLEPPVTTDPFELILLENAAYLVDDARRAEVFAVLKKQVGSTPEAILAAPFEKLVAAIRRGGMRPEDRAVKLCEAASLAKEEGLPALRQLMKTAPKDARKILKRFPGIGDPGADKLLLIAGSLVTLAPESNGLRVLTRLGYASESKSYSQTYRAAAEAVAPGLPDDPKWLLEAHLLLRRHGQELCKRNEPRCDICPLSKSCSFALASG